MALSSHSLSSIELVQPEIDSTIQQAEDSLSKFVENRDDGEPLQNCIDCLNQLRGIYVLVEVQACVILCQQSVGLANEVPVGATEDKNDLLSLLSNAIFVLRRYTEYFCSDKVDHPELLLPVINELRAASQEKPYSESHFFELTAKPSDVFNSLSLSLGDKLDNYEHHARRFRHMFQVGLLDIIRERNEKVALKLIARASEGCARLCDGEALANLWVLTNFVAQSMQRNDMQITDMRKRLFMRIERYLREMVMAGKGVAAKSVPDSLVKDLIYLLCLSSDQDEKIISVLKAFEIENLDIDEKTRLLQTKRLFGPGADVLKSLAKAIQEELTILKEKLDVLERGGEPKEEDINFIADSLKRMSGTLSMLDLQKSSTLCTKLLEQVNEWFWDVSPGIVPDAQLFTVANGILAIESAFKQYQDTGSEPNVSFDSLMSETDDNIYLSEARIIVVEEALNAMVLVKRSVGSYVESQGDKLHLANLKAVMQSAAGSMIMLDQSRVADILKASERCINDELLESPQVPGSTLLETLADALSSLEYYIESMGVKEFANDELLKLSEESLSSIGYAVA